MHEINKNLFFNEVDTLHLKLRRPILDDIPTLGNLWRDPKVRQFLGGVISDDMIKEKIILIQDHWNKYGFGQWSVLNKHRHQILGICGLHYSEDGIELSYMFFHTSWGKGVANEAALATLYYGFNTLKRDEIIAITQEANHRSCNLLENIGMHYVNSFLRFNANQRLYKITKTEFKT